MIKSFRCGETASIFSGRFSKRLPQEIQRKAAARLAILHAASRLETLRIPPGNRLEALAGSRAGQHSIRVNDPWRICFVWREADAHDVELVDYHKG